MTPEPKSLKFLPFEWDALQQIARSLGMSRHRLMADAVRSSLSYQNTDVA